MMIAGSKPSGEEAAVWVPDQSANICMVCQKTKFTAIVRKVGSINVL